MKILKKGRGFLTKEDIRRLNHPWVGAVCSCDKCGSTLRIEERDSKKVRRIGNRAENFGALGTEVLALWRTRCPVCQKPVEFTAGVGEREKKRN